MASFVLGGAGRNEVFQFFESLRLCVPATTLGDVHTLVLYPAHSFHRALSLEGRRRIGIGNGPVCLSVGIEAEEDIINGLDQELARLD